MHVQPSVEGNRQRSKTKRYIKPISNGYSKNSNKKLVSLLWFSVEKNKSVIYIVGHMWQWQMWGMLKRDSIDDSKQKTRYWRGVSKNEWKCNVLLSIMEKYHKYVGIIKPSKLIEMNTFSAFTKYSIKNITTYT